MNDYIFITYPLCIVEKLKKKGKFYDVLFVIVVDVLQVFSF